MRIPTNVSKTANAYLAFRAVLREGLFVINSYFLSCYFHFTSGYVLIFFIAVQQHNELNPADPIRSILCPGLGTAVGRMPYLRCAVQMKTAFDAVIHKDMEDINRPTDLSRCCSSHVALTRVCLR